MKESLFQLLEAIVPVLCTIITYYIIPFIKEKINNEQLVKYQQWAKIAVESAEMLILGSGKGADKKVKAIEILDGIINKNKAVISKEQLEVLIESACMEMNKNK